MYELSVFRTKISVSFGFLAAVTLMFIFDKNLNTVMATVAFVLHEISHIVFIKLFGGNVNLIKFTLIELDIKTETTVLNNFQNLVVSLAGSVINFILAFAFVNINLSFSSVNLVVGCFQILPIASLDGGNALAFLGVPSKIRFGISLLTAFVFAVFGFMILLNNKYNFSILAISLYLIYVSFANYEKSD